MPSMTIKFGKERETKGAIRYEELNDHGAVISNMYAAKIGKVYFRKDAFKGGYPEKLTLKVEWED